MHLLSLDDMMDLLHQSFSSDDYFSIYPVAKVIEGYTRWVTRLETDKLDIDDFIVGADLYFCNWKW